MRHAATQALLERNDVVVVASVSCIYGIGSVETYARMVVKLETGGRIDRDALAKGLVDLQYRRNDAAFQRGTFRLRGETRGHLPEPLRGPRLARHAVRRRGGGDPRIRSADRREDCGTERDHGLRQQPLCHAAADADAGDPRHQGGTEGSGWRS